MTTLEKCLDIIATGGDVRVSFSERCVWHKRKPMELDFSDITKTECVQDALDVIENLYEKYKHSRTDKNSRQESISAYFEAIPYERLTPQDLLNEPRPEARIKLEVTVLGLIVNGSLWWDENVFTGWWYSSPTGLTLKRKWVERTDLKTHPNPPCEGGSGQA